MSAKNYLKRAAEREKVEYLSLVDAIVSEIPKFMYEYLAQDKVVAAAQMFRFYKSKAREVCRRSALLRATVRGTYVFIFETLEPEEPEIVTYLPVNLGLKLLSEYESIPWEKDLSDEDRKALTKDLMLSPKLDVNQVEAVLGDMYAGKHNCANFFVSRTETFVEGPCLNLFVWGRDSCKYVLLPKYLLETLKRSHAPTTEGYMEE